MAVIEAMMSVWTPPSNAQQADGRLGGNARHPGVVAFESHFGLCPGAGWVVPSALLPRVCFLSSSASFFFFILRRMGKNKAVRSSPHFHVFSYASCVDLTQLLSQPTFWVFVFDMSATMTTVLTPPQYYNKVIIIPVWLLPPM